MQAAHHAVGLAENKLVRRRGDALPVQPGGEIGRRLCALAKVDHVVEDAVETQRVRGHRGGKTQRRRRQALRLRLRHLDGRNEYLQHLVAGEEVGLVAFVGGLRQVPLQGVAQIDRQGNVARMFPAQRRHERQQVGDAREDDGDGVDVDAGDLLDRPARRCRGCQPRGLRGGEHGAHQMEQEGAGAAGRVHHALFERRIHGSRHHACGEPVRGVVLAQVVAGFGVDQAFVEGLEDVHADVLQAKAVDVPRNAQHQVPAGRVGQRPVEEIRLALPADPGIGERGAVQQRFSVLRRGLDQRRPGDGLGDHGQVGVLQEQGVVADLRAVGQAEQVFPQLPLQERLRRGAERGPQPAEVVEGAPGGQAVAPEFARDGVRVGQQAVADGHDALQPSQQRLRR